ncbi:hypothetical protein P7K49_007363 [Saguinus oedipus]|uniref:Uncharacterized protein n=1 Tax=Saguinus oedipus TaxID=9490 RepID=A0ABQ9VUU4_SAGOE|nr:hypothetical protein P7K49_007363 [Saguinus oedipus]
MEQIEMQKPTPLKDTFTATAGASVLCIPSQCERLAIMKAAVFLTVPEGLLYLVRFKEVDLLMYEEWDAFDLKTKDRCQQDCSGPDVHSCGSC